MNDIERAIEDLKERVIFMEDFLKEKESMGTIVLDKEKILNSIALNKLSIIALEKQLNGGWIPFKTEYDEDYNMDMLQEEIPDDEQEILVTDGKSVWSDTFMRDGMECYLDSGDDLIITVKAWMKLPEPYKEVDNEVYI